MTDDGAIASAGDSNLRQIRIWDYAECGLLFSKFGARAKKEITAGGDRKITKDVTYLSLSRV